MSPSSRSRWSSWPLRDRCIDPDLTVPGAELQLPRIARARGVPVARVEALLDEQMRGTGALALGTPRVNVLRFNLALDELGPVNDGRPTPEEMLVRAAEEEARAGRGDLKVFFGAAPGVGKTYAMLEAGQRQRALGVDVVLGWVETHGRAETEALTVGFERMPARRVEHGTMVLAEFDLEAALARQPELILVDELPHTNAAGLAPPRRWQDVEELLAAGSTSTPRSTSSTSRASTTWSPRSPACGSARPSPTL